MDKEKILVIDDDESTRDSLELFLNKLNYTPILAADAKEGLEVFQRERPDLVISDLMLPGDDGISVMQKVKEFDDKIPVIIITAFEDMDTTIKAMQLGAYDYIEKPLDISRLKFIIVRALETSYLSRKLESVTSYITEESFSENQIIGKAPQIREILKRIGQISSNRVNVLINGESGTGKELISRVIHFSGVTSSQPFIAVNSAALPENLLESELFGHEKGSFTGAIREKKGKFELAGDGTIFLDEISEITPNLQVKLLRVIQEREFERVGGEKIIPMKARIIAATNRNLEELVASGKFREDLYYRLNVFTIKVPALRERKQDIPTLVVHFLAKINRELHKKVVKIPYEVIDMLQNYEWVGNVRELENTLKQAVVLAKGEVLEKENILLHHKSPQTSSSSENQDLSLAAIEKEHIINVLQKVKWDKKEASRVLKISRQTLYNKLKAYSITQN